MRRAAVLLLLLTLLWAPDALMGDGIYGAHDLRHHHLPWRVWAASEWSSGRVPLWAPGVANGFPLMADGQTGVFYAPTMLLFMALPAGLAMNATVLLHHLWAGLGALGWLRRRGHSEDAALIGAIAWGFSGFLASHTLYLGMQAVLAWLPWLLWAITATLDAGEGRRRILGMGPIGLCAAMMLVAGHPQMAAFGLLLAGLFALGGAARLVLRGQASEAAAGLVAAGLGVGLGLAAASPQVLATLELLQFTMRDGGVDELFSRVGSMPVQELVGGVLPTAFGFDRPVDVPETYYHRGLGYWGAGVNHWEMCFYLGVPVAGLAVLGIPRAPWMVGLGLLGVALMVGSPLWDLVRALPGFGGFRFPARFGSWVTVAVAVLAAAGVDQLRSRPPARLRRLGLEVLGLAGVLLVGVLATGVALDVGEDDLRQVLTERFTSEVAPPPPPGALPELSPLARAVLPEPEPEDPALIPAKVDRIVASLRRSTDPLDGRVLVPLALMVGLALVVLLGSRRPRSAWVTAALVVLVYADLWAFGANYQARVAPGEVLEEPAVLDVIEAAGGRWRTTVVDRRQHPDLDTELISASLGLLHGTRDVILTSPLLILRNEALLAAAGLDVGDKGTVKVDRLRAHPGLVDLLGVRWLLSVHDLSEAGYPAVPVDGLEHSPVGLYENEDALPGALLVGCQAVTPAPWEQLESFDPRAVVRTEADLGLPSCADGRGAGTARIVDEDPVRIELEIDPGRASVLVQQDGWYPGWTAEVDGERRELHLVDLVFRGVVVGPGDRSVVLRYAPDWAWSLWLAAACWLLLVVLALLELPRTRSSRGLSRGASSTG